MKLLGSEIIPLDSYIHEMPLLIEKLHWRNWEAILNLWGPTANLVRYSCKSVRTVGFIIEKRAKLLTECSELFQISLYNVFVVGFVSYENDCIFDVIVENANHRETCKGKKNSVRMRPKPSYH